MARKYKRIKDDRLPKMYNQFMEQTVKDGYERINKIE